MLPVQYWLQVREPFTLYFKVYITSSMVWQTTLMVLRTLQTNVYHYVMCTATCTSCACMLLVDVIDSPVMLTLVRFTETAHVLRIFPYVMLLAHFMQCYIYSYVCWFMCVEVCPPTVHRVKSQKSTEVGYSWHVCSNHLCISDSLVTHGTIEICFDWLIAFLIEW